MCSVDDRPADTGPTPQIEKLRLKGSSCVKCDKPGVLITRIHDAFCKDCFQVYVVHKFRSAIGKSKLIRDGETVLVAFSGGANSSALLHLIQDGLSHRAHKRLRFTPVLLHIDENGLIGKEDSGSSGKSEKIKQIMQQSGFPSYWMYLEQGLNLDLSSGGPVSLSEDKSEHSSSCGPVKLGLCKLDGQTELSETRPGPDLTRQLQEFIRGMGNSTAQEDVLYNFKRQMLVMAANQLGFRKVLTAETSTRLAIRVLSDVAQGRGSQVALDTGISDDRNAGVMFMRPVRDLNAKELSMYNNLFQVDSVFTPNLTTKSGLASSIARLTETFVTGLQAEFPSTVSNIVRTSEKLGLPQTAGKDKCSFCQSPLDTNVGKASALGAVLFSQQMSRLNSGNTGDQPQCTVNGSGPVQSNGDAGRDSSVADLSDSLCYGCRLSLNVFNGDVRSFPPIINKKSSQKIREHQREQLSEYLLDEGNGT